MVHVAARRARGPTSPAAVAEVRESANRHDGTFRLDVLVMAMVDAHHAGVAFSEPGTYDDVANVTDGLADRLVSGEVEGETGAPPPPGAPHRTVGRLGCGHCCDEARAVFGDEPWDIEWADDGDHVLARPDPADHDADHP